ncbi:MAG: M48 family metalloprotease [Sulfuritalea sp.]|nr:M48 family metalloprotease [Sulfuritalea sp.]
MAINMLEGAHRVAKRILISLGAVALLIPHLAYAHPWCNGAAGMYAEEWIQILQNDKSPGKDVTIQDRTAANLKAWLNANQRIAKTAGFTQRVFVCDLPRLNAFVTTRSEPVRVHAETVYLLGANEDVIAAVLGHEYSHLSLNHMAKKVAARETLRTWKSRAYENVLRRTWNSQEASNVANLVGKSEWSAFSIQHELEADNFGITLLGKSGYKPTAFFSLGSIARALYGDTSAEAFPTHPGIVERMMKGYERVTDETFDQTASGLKANSDFGSISNLLKDWMSRLPDSGNARYYKAILLRQLKNPKATETMEDALLPTRKPTLSQREDETNSAWLWLCTQLYREGFTVESAWCGETQLKRDERLWAKFQSRTFQERIWVGYRNDGAAGDGTLYLGFIRKPDGTKLITNSVSTAASYGVTEDAYTPLWRPIRFKACEGRKEKPCPRDSAEQPMAVVTSERDPFRDIRANCKQPNCENRNF